MTAVALLSLTAATLAQNVPSYVPSDGLVGWWPFNGNANDESGNHGIVDGDGLSADRNSESEILDLGNGIKKKRVVLFEAVIEQSHSSAQNCHFQILRKTILLEVL